VGRSSTGSRRTTSTNPPTSHSRARHSYPRDGTKTAEACGWSPRNHPHHDVRLSVPIRRDDRPLQPRHRTAPRVAQRGRASRTVRPANRELALIGNPCRPVRHVGRRSDHGDVSHRLRPHDGPAWGVTPRRQTHRSPRPRAGAGGHDRSRNRRSGLARGQTETSPSGWHSRLRRRHDRLVSALKAVAHGAGLGTRSRSRWT
jgi:hypothetical protein